MKVTTALHLSGCFIVIEDGVPWLCDANGVKVKYKLTGKDGTEAKPMTCPLHKIPLSIYHRGMSGSAFVVLDCERCRKEEVKSK